jgi:hypothetical protein
MRRAETESTAVGWRGELKTLSRQMPVPFMARTALELHIRKQRQNR